MRALNIGGPIFFGIIGAILVLAIQQEQFYGIDVNMIGIILMVAALVWLVLGFIAARPQTAATRERTSPDGTQREVISEID